MPPQNNPITLSYSTLFSLIGSLLTLKLYHAISSLTHGWTPSRTTIQTIEHRIVTGFIHIVQGPSHQPPPGFIDGDGDADPLGLHYHYNTLNPTSSQYRENPASAYPYLHSLPPRVPGRDPSRTGPRSGSGRGTNSTHYSPSHGYGYSRPSSINPTPMFHFSAFDLPSNQTRTHTHPHPRRSSPRDIDESSFVRSLAMCAPYQRAGLRLPRVTATSQDQHVDGVFGCASVSVSGVRVSPSVSECTPKMTPSEDLEVVDAFPVRGRGNPDIDSSLDTDTDTDRDPSQDRNTSRDRDTGVDLEACLYEPVRLANSFPGDCPVTVGTETGSGSGVARPGSRGKSVISVRPFSDLD